MASSIAACSPARKCCILLSLPAARGAATAKPATTTGEAATAKPATAGESPTSKASAAAAPSGPWNDDRTAIATLRGGRLRAAPHDPDEPEKDSGPEDHHGPVHGGILAVTRLCALLNLCSVTRQCQRDVTHAVLDATRKVASSEAGQDRVGDDDLRQRVGERGLKPTSHFDAHFAFVRCDDEEHAVIELLRANAPVAAELIAIILDGIALQRWDRDHHHLVGALFLE